MLPFLTQPLRCHKMLAVSRPADGNREPPALIEFLPKEWASKNWQLHPDDAYRVALLAPVLLAPPGRFASILVPASSKTDACTKQAAHALKSRYARGMVDYTKVDYTKVQ